MLSSLGRGAALLRRAGRWTPGRDGAVVLGCCAAAVLGWPTQVLAQSPQPAERVTFAEAIQRAVERNPSSAVAAAGILRAEALLTEARSGARLQIAGTVTTTTLNTGVEFNGITVTPRNSVTGLLDIRMPVFAPARWARRAAAADQKDVAELSAAEARRQIALAVADAYLAIIARRRVVEANERARDVAKAHFDLAAELEQRGTGSRLNELRAQQELSIDEGLVEEARLALYRAQEALAVLMVADGPVDASEEPGFELPPDPPPPLPDRSDIRLFSARVNAADRVFRDSSKDRQPYLEGIFQPQTIYPSSLFTPANICRLLFQASIPIVDVGQRTGQRVERQAELDVSRATLAGALTAASSEIRTAREAIASDERALESAKAAADQAQQVVNIVNVSFRAGAATNIEVIDAERRARDADTAAAVAEDTLRRARLELLTALGRFP